MINESILDKKPLGGGSICETSLIDTPSGRYVLKELASADKNLFFQEAKGLRALKDSGNIKAPRVVEVSERHLVLEYISTEPPQEEFWRNLGRDLAHLHQNKISQLGLDSDNFIGANPQKNTPHKIYHEHSDWLEFFWDYRLMFQLSLMKNRSQRQKVKQELSNQREKIFDLLSGGAEEQPCLLHGDLWSGNILCGEKQVPYLIDPAIYFGHREADLAMTQMFGGFHYVFYESYQKTYPLKPGWPKRLKIYQLYHYLNHWNLFGDSYAEPVFKILKEATL